MATWIWTHGIAGVVDYPADFPDFPGPPASIPVRFVTRSDSGLSLTPPMPSTHSLYFPISSTPILDGTYQNASKIRVVFEAIDATIDSIALHDGTGEIFRSDNLAWSGTFETVSTAKGFNFDASFPIHGALSFSMSVTFHSPKTLTLAGKIRVMSVGVELVPGETVVGRLIRFISSLFRG